MNHKNASVWRCVWRPDFAQYYTKKQMYAGVGYLLRVVAACCSREKPQRSLNVYTLNATSKKSLRRMLPCLSRLISSARQHVLCYSDTCSVSHSGLCSHRAPSKHSGGSVSRGSVVKSVWYAGGCNTSPSWSTLMPLAERVPSYLDFKMRIQQLMTRLEVTQRWTGGCSRLAGTVYIHVFFNLFALAFLYQSTANLGDLSAERLVLCFSHSPHESKTPAFTALHLFRQAPLENRL